MDFDTAIDLAMSTDYACFAVEEQGNEINRADAGAFFMEGYLYAINNKSLLTVNILRGWNRDEIVDFAKHLIGDSA